MSNKERVEQQIAIRLKYSDGYRYERYRDDNVPGTLPAKVSLTLETAKNQLGIYTSSAEATIVTRKVLIWEGEWEEIETNEIKELAAFIHKKQCHYNHIDQCDWEYSKNSSTHTKYEEKAKTILEKTSFKAAKELLEIL